MSDKAPYGWIWLDDDGWEHDPDSQHPHERGEAEYGTGFRPATQGESVSSDFLRVPKIVYRLGGPSVSDGNPTGEDRDGLRAKPASAGPKDDAHV